MKPDRFLLAILVIIGLLVIVALGLFFMRRNAQAYGPDDNPEGVVRNYLLALSLGDYEKAYGYLALTDSRPDYENFERTMIRREVGMLENSVRIVSSKVTNDRATVVLNILRAEVELFETNQGYTESASLHLEDGAWKITRMPYSFWY